MNVIERLRRENGYNQKDFSRMIGVSQNTLSGYENDRNLEHISLITLMKLSEVINMSIDDIVKQLAERI